MELSALRLRLKIRMNAMKRIPATVYAGLGALLLILILAACTPSPTQPPAAPVRATRSPAASHTPQLVSPMPTERPTETPPPGDVPLQEDLTVDLTVADLAARLESAPSAVDVVSVEAVVWPDSSLGCPRPGEFYLQVETPGWRITLRAEGETYDYHASERGTFVLCQNGNRLEPIIPPEGRVPNEMVQQAVDALASRLDVSESEIDVVSVEEVTWRDGSLGCPQPGRAYTQALVRGSRIILEAEGREWHYHSGGGREPFLCMNPQEPLEARDGAEDN